jgi:hypothetical protein
MEQAADCHRGLRLSGGWYLQGASIGNLTLAGLDFNLLSRRGSARLRLLEHASARVQ